MTMLTLSKNLRRGRPSSPHWAMAIPVTTANTTRPRMFVELGMFRRRVRITTMKKTVLLPGVEEMSTYWDHSLLKFQVSLSVAFMTRLPLASRTWVARSDLRT